MSSKEFITNLLESLSNVKKEVEKVSDLLHESEKEKKALEEKLEVVDKWFLFFTKNKNLVVLQQQVR